MGVRVIVPYGWLELGVPLNLRSDGRRGGIPRVFPGRVRFKGKDPSLRPVVIELISWVGCRLAEEKSGYLFMLGRI